MMWDRTQDPFRWFDEILVDVFQISWSDSSEIRVQSLVSRLPSLIIPRIPSSRCLWSLAATLAQTYSYLFAVHHVGWLQDLHDWNKTFKEEKQRQLAAVFLALWSHLIWSLLALPWERRRLVPLASCPNSQSWPSWRLFTKKERISWPDQCVWWLLNFGSGSWFFEKQTPVDALTLYQQSFEDHFMRSNTLNLCAIYTNYTSLPPAKLQGWARFVFVATKAPWHGRFLPNGASA